MSLSSDLRDVLVADGTVNGFVAGRVSPNILEQDGTYPAISYQRVAQEDSHGLGGLTSNDLVNAQIDVNIWADSHADAHAIATAAKKAIDASVLLNSMDYDTFDDYQPSDKRYLVILTVSLWHLGG